MSSAGTPEASAIASGEFCGCRMNASHSANASGSQRSPTNARSARPSVTITWAIALTIATLVPGRRARWWAASTWADRTRSMRRGSTTMSARPSRSRRFIRAAKTGWASVGFAPITRMTSLSATEAKSCVPAEVPNVCVRP